MNEEFKKNRTITLNRRASVVTIDLDDLDNDFSFDENDTIGQQKRKVYEAYVEEYGAGDVCGLDLSQCDFSDAFLTCRNFSYCDLTGAIFTNADVGGTTFHHAIMKGVNTEDIIGKDIDKILDRFTEAQVDDTFVTNILRKILERNINVSEELKKKMLSIIGDDK